MLAPIAGMTARAEHIEPPPPIGRSRFQQTLAVLYAAIFVWSAAFPHDRGDWALENILVVAAVATLAATHRRFRFSNLSWLLIFGFLALHAVGSHYTYSYAPPGEWLASTFGTSRNHYDRLVHFAFGLLITYPLREVARRVMHVRGAWAYIVPVLGVLSFSASYEIAEWWAARAVAPELGVAFVGSQGDIWDAQKDMSLALFGAAVACVVTALHWRATGQEPWGLFARAIGHPRRSEATYANPWLLLAGALLGAAALLVYAWLGSMCR